MMRTNGVATGILILFCMLCMVPVLAAGSPGYWDPWVTRTSTTSATINWWQESPGSGWTVEYANASYYDQYGTFDHTAADPSPDPANFHHVILTGLAPGTSYAYLVVPPGTTGVFSARRFQTFPAGGPFTFIVISDTHANEQRFGYVADAISNEKDVLFILDGGDYASHDNVTQWTDYFTYGSGMLANYSLMTSIGNHEYHIMAGDNLSPTEAYEYSNAFGNPLNYSFDCSGVRFIVMDSPDPQDPEDENPTSAHSESQAAWLKDQLASSPSGTFVIHHHPVWTHGRATADTALQSWETLFHAYPISADFSGHIHTYQRFSVDGIPYFVVANAGGGFVTLTDDGKPTPSPYVYGSTKNLGYLRVTVDPANNTATADEYYVAALSDYNSTTAAVIDPPLLADHLVFPLKGALPSPAGNAGYGSFAAAHTGGRSPSWITSPSDPSGNSMIAVLNRSVSLMHKGHVLRVPLPHR
jgi:acid phosphatase type 7